MRHLQITLMHLQDRLMSYKTALRCLLWDIYNLSCKGLFKISYEYVLWASAKCLACLDKTSLRHLVDVFLPAGYHLKGNTKA